MLVHKRTMGVLDRYWTGRYTTWQGESVPLMAEYTMEGGGFPREEWWEVPRDSPLGRRVRILYPFCTPVVDENGGLVGVMPEKTGGMSIETPPAKGRRRPRRRGLMEDLFAEL